MSTTTPSAAAAAESGGVDARKSTRQLVLVAPLLEGIPQSKDFRVEQVPIRSLTEGGIEVQLLVLSVDTYLRGKMQRAKPRSPINGFVAGKITASKNVDYKIGDLVGCLADFKERQVFTQEELKKKGALLFVICCSLFIVHCLCCRCTRANSCLCMCVLK